MRTVGLWVLFVALLSGGCQDAEAPSQDRQVISTDAAPEAVGPYSQAIQVGNQIYCSGQIGIDPATGSLVEGGVAAETRQALENLEAVLGATGASLDDAVQTQVFLADVGDYSVMNEVYASHFDAPPAGPCRCGGRGASCGRPGRNHGYGAQVTGSGTDTETATWKRAIRPGPSTHPPALSPSRWRHPVSGNPWLAACRMASTNRSNSTRVVYTDGDTRMP